MSVLRLENANILLNGVLSTQLILAGQISMLKLGSGFLVKKLALLRSAKSDLLRSGDKRHILKQQVFSLRYSLHTYKFFSSLKWLVR